MTRKTRTWAEKERIRRVQELRRSNASGLKPGRIQQERRRPKYPLKKEDFDD